MTDLDSPDTSPDPRVSPQGLLLVASCFDPRLVLEGNKRGSLQGRLAGDRETSWRYHQLRDNHTFKFAWITQQFVDEFLVFARKINGGQTAITNLKVMTMEFGMVRLCSKFVLFACLGLLGFAAAPASAATLKATVDLSKQRMYVFVDGRKKYSWPVSTGKRGWRTKTGYYTPFAQRKNFYSSKWRMSLPYLTMIGRDGTAIHGTYLTSRLGRPASHGCIRLSVGNAAKFYKLVQNHGFWSTQIHVQP